MEPLDKFTLKQVKHVNYVNFLSGRTRRLFSFWRSPVQSSFSLRLECKPRTVEICENAGNWAAQAMQTNSMPPPVGALAFLQRQQEFALMPWGQHGLVLSADIICRYGWDMSYVSISLYWWWSEETQANCILYTHWMGLWIWYELSTIGIVFI
jgi:hypothetical protein